MSEPTQTRLQAAARHAPKAHGSSAPSREFLTTIDGVAPALEGHDQEVYAKLIFKSAALEVEIGALRIRCSCGLSLMRPDAACSQQPNGMCEIFLGLLLNPKTDAFQGEFAFDALTHLRKKPGKMGDARQLKSGRLPTLILRLAWPSQRSENYTKILRNLKQY
jgi:hypothetical protein